MENTHCMQDVNNRRNMQNMHRGPMSQQSNAERQGYDSCNKNSYGSRNDVPFYMQNDGGGSRRPYCSDNNQNGFMKQYDNSQNGYVSKSSGKLPEEMPEMPGQMPSPRYGNNGNSHQECFPGVRRNSNPQTGHQQMPGEMPEIPGQMMSPRYGSSYQEPPRTPGRRNSNPQSGSGFNIRHV